MMLDQLAKAKEALLGRRGAVQDTPQPAASQRSQDGKAMEKAFEICRPGTFVDASGNLVPVTEDSLREMAMGYNPKLRRAALVIGHPKMDDPAFGWVRDLEYRDTGILDADGHATLVLGRSQSNRPTRLGKFE